ncbi:hypothetical protein, partial [Meiothermus hypogaeus]|uniref:hypothetical protein n=1 Tax=Meiothermus hypogaeus TaxID=884155 RepID=UPI001C99C667
MAKTKRGPRARADRRTARHSVSASWAVGYSGTSLFALSSASCTPLSLFHHLLHHQPLDLFAKLNHQQLLLGYTLPLSQPLVLIHQLMHPFPYFAHSNSLGCLPIFRTHPFAHRPTIGWRFCGKIKC